MIYDVINLGDGTYKIMINFRDEGIDLEGETTAKGKQEDAERYAKVFEKDLRTNYAHLFPQPEPEHDPEWNEEDEVMDE